MAARRQLVRWMVATVAILYVNACAPDRQLHRFQGFAQGTMYHVAYVAPAGHDSGALQRRVDAELHRIDRAYSNYLDDSVIERFNARASTAPMAVGPELVALIGKARRVHSDSDGCFDPTLLPLTRLWRNATEEGSIPDPLAIARARARVGMDALESPGPRRLRKKIPELAVDLSGIAQGESLARLARVVEADGIRSYSIEIGGEVIVRGVKPGAVPWRIAVLDPAHGDSALPGVIEHAGDRPITIATSGTYQRAVEIDGRRYAHVIDPRTGRPVTHDTVSVTVIHTDPALADAWSTALLCLGAEQGAALAERQGLAAQFVQRDGEVRRSSAMPSLVEN